MPSHFSLYALAMWSGVLNCLLAVTIWLMLNRRHHSRPVLLWSLGALSLGIGLWLFGARTLVPDWASYQLANALLQLSMFLRISALRFDLQLPLCLGRNFLLTVGAMLGYHVCRMLPDRAPEAVFGALVLVAGLAALGRHSLAAGRATPSRSGTVMAWAHGVASALLLARMVWLVRGEPLPSVQDSNPWLLTLLLVAAVAAMLYSNLGYLGLVLDRVKAAETRAEQARHAASTGMAAAEQTAESLRVLLAERDRLVEERSHLLQLLAHEIRQPMHNASGALQAAALAVHAQPGGHDNAAHAPLVQAQEVLGHMQSVLDNALASTELLSSREPLLLQEVEIDTVVQLAIGDLPSDARRRVRCVHQTSLRMAELEPRLMRLALSNLLRNAIRHGGAQADIELRLAETMQPPALVLSVRDTGQGVGNAWLVEQQRRTNDTTAPLTARGLGLHIVRRVMALHGGQLVFAANRPHGLVASLVLPLPAEDDGAPVPTA